MGDARRPGRGGCPEGPPTQDWQDALRGARWVTGGRGRATERLLEAARLRRGLIAMRRPGHPDGAVLVLPGDEVEAWLQDLKAGLHDDLLSSEARHRGAEDPPRPAGPGLVLRPSGDLVGGAVDGILDRWLAAVGAGPPDGVTVDLTGTAAIDSCGMNMLRFLCTYLARRGVPCRVRGMPPLRSAPPPTSGAGTGPDGDGEAVP